MYLSTTLRHWNTDEWREYIVIHSFIEWGISIRKCFAVLCSNLFPQVNLKHVLCYFRVNNIYDSPLLYFCVEAVVVVIIWQLDFQLPMQSVPITTNVEFESGSRESQSMHHYGISLSVTSGRSLVYSGFLHQYN